ncbi:MAG: hypothetical protein PHQ86_04630 [Dehalococcoidales bacterium]|nr:hypothetical protein [Dehalococcoidales bacterium]
MKQLPITFPCGDIRLEGVWHFPEEIDTFPVVIVCHPHSLYGGSMSNDVVITICQELAKQSIVAFRFNFRGVGKSEGAFGGGITEQEDVNAALAVVPLTTCINPEKIGLSGYSFGVKVVLPVALSNAKVNLLALVSPPLTDVEWGQLNEYSKSKYFIIGGNDHLIAKNIFTHHINNVREPVQYEVVTEADHFWWGYEEEVARKVTRFFSIGFD